MSKFLVKAFLYLFFILTSSICRAEVKDSQVWSDVSFEKKIDDFWIVQFEEEMRVGDDIEKLVYQHSDVGVVYRYAKWLDVGVNYRYITRKKELETKEHENRPHFNLTLIENVGDWQISNRNRFEYRMISRTKDIERYANKTTLKWAGEWGALGLSPFGSYEYFLDLDQDEFNFARISYGLEFIAARNIKGELYYLRQDSRDRSLDAKRDVTGLALRIDF